MLDLIYCIGFAFIGSLIGLLILPWLVPFLEPAINLLDTYFEWVNSFFECVSSFFKKQD